MLSGFPLRGHCDRVNMFRLARRIERYATRKGLQLPW